MHSTSTHPRGVDLVELGGLHGVEELYLLVQDGLSRVRVAECNGFTSAQGLECVDHGVLELILVTGVGRV